MTTQQPSARSYAFLGQKVKDRWAKRCVNHAQIDPFQPHPAFQNKKDLYITLAEYSDSTSKKLENIKALSWFGVDIDPPKGVDVLPADVLRAIIRSILVQAKLLPYVILSTGRGCHIYWRLDKPETDIDAWRACAEALWTLLSALEIDYLDPVFTKDPTRSVRLVGTVNSRSGRIVHCLLEPKKSHSIDTFRKAWGAAARVARKPTPVINTDTHGCYLRNIKRHCELIATVLREGGENASEPQWKEHLNLAAFCNDGAAHIHPLSKGHATYDSNATEAKFARQQQARQTGAFGPPSCSTLESYDPSICNKCGHKSWIRSPIELGQDVNGLEFPYGYLQTQKGIYFTGSERRESGVVLGYRAEDARLATASEDQYQEVFEADFKVNGAQTLTRIPLADMNDTRKILSHLGASNIIVPPKQQRVCIDFMTSWAQQVQAAKARKKRLEDHFGWQRWDGKDGFSFNERLYLPKNETVPHRLSEPSLVNAYRVKGKREVWEAAAALVRSQDAFELDSLVLSAFAAPAIHFTGIPGSLLCVKSQASGVGKTSAMRVAQSVWSSPTSTFFHVDDTPLSVARRAGHIHSLSMHWDDLMNRHIAERFNEQVTFRFAQGKERSRLRSDTSFNTTGFWRSLLVVCANLSLREQISEINGAVEAGLQRVFELEREVRPISNNLATSMVTFGQLDENHGHIGAEYAQFLVNNYAACQQLMQQIMARLEKVLAVDPKERFWLAVVAALIFAAVVTTRYLKVYNLNIKEYSEFLQQQFIRHRKYVTAKLPTEQEILHAYMSSNKPYQLVTRSLTDGVILFPPLRGVAHYHIAVQERKLLITESSFARWCLEEKRSPDVEKQRLITLYRAAIHMGSLGKGTYFSSGGKTPIITIDLNQPDLIDQLGIFDKS